MCGVLDAHGTDAHAVDTDAVCGILFWWYSTPMAMMLMPFPCPVVTVTDAHGTDAHAVDTHAMCGILWRCPTCNYCNLLHRGSCRNQIPMAMMPIEPMPIPYPLNRYRCRVWHLLEVTGIYAADTMNQMPMPMILIPCPASSILMQPMPCVASCSGGTRHPWP